MRYPDSTVIDVNSIKAAFDQLEIHREQSTALDFTLMLLDRDLDHETRAFVAEGLDNLILKANCRDYVLDVLYAAPLPRTADVEGAKKSSSANSRVKSLYSDIESNQRRVKHALYAWLRFLAKPSVQNTKHEEIRAAFHSTWSIPDASLGRYGRRQSRAGFRNALG